MSKKQGFWANILGIQPERERFSLEELKHLHDVLQQNSTVTDANRELVVETLRSIAELMIWYHSTSPFCQHHRKHNPSASLTMTTPNALALLR